MGGQLDKLRGCCCIDLWLSRSGPGIRAHEHQSTLDDWSSHQRSTKSTDLDLSVALVRGYWWSVHIKISVLVFRLAQIDSPPNSHSEQASEKSDCPAQNDAPEHGTGPLLPLTVPIQRDWHRADPTADNTSHGSSPDTGFVEREPGSRDVPPRQAGDAVCVEDGQESEEGDDITVADLISLDPIEIARKCPREREDERVRQERGRVQRCTESEGQNRQRDRW